jgi:coproporphyrinogen III oxidase-like Fe-S oxidoreductase
MTNFSHSTIQRSLTTGFKSSLLPLYDISHEVPVEEESSRLELSSPGLSSIAPMGINIYCPRQRVEDYEHLICQEVTLRRSLYNRHQPVASIWWRGSPLQQFSPEAITELCFRLSSHFTHQQEGSTRGMAVTPMELEKTNLALMKGLNFTAIQLHIDASVASGDRSLSKIETALQLLSDYRSFELSCVIKFSAQTHPDFLDRLLNLLEISHCNQIEVLSQKSGPTSLQDRMASQNQLARINQHFQDCRWRGCGNNNFFAPSHAQGTVSQQSKLEATPWGYMARSIPVWLGFGIAALSLDAGRYQYNTPSSEHYVNLLADRKLPVHSHFRLADNKTVNFQLIQQLLCEHTMTPTTAQLHRRLASLIPREWLKEEDDKLTLNTLGVVNLSSICDKLSTAL